MEVKQRAHMMLLLSKVPHRRNPIPGMGSDSHSGGGGDGVPWAGARRVTSSSSHPGRG